MTGKRAGWFTLGLIPVLGFGPLALWTVVFALSAEYKTATWRELVLVAMAIAVLAGGLAALWRALRSGNPTTAVRPLLLALLATLFWFATAPL